METISRESAWEILTKYNKEPFHLQHAETVEGVMKWFADDLGFSADRDYWGVVGLLHDVDFEMYPDRHCLKAPELLREGGVGEDVIRSVVSHGWQLTVDVKPEHVMEKVLYAVDELTGLVWATALMRPSKSVQDLEVKSVRKKFKTLNFAAGCSREVISRGAELLGWTLDDLIAKTIEAMRSVEKKG
ncbi:MAG: hydrolase [Deltaproteobacteria bacterium]|jgi:predicted hydrolase (HD superfamily)|nr:hydrolase [Deltaproteobacteria bacterium]